MAGETNLNTLLKSMQPELNEGEYVFCVLPESIQLPASDIICSFKEKEGQTVVVTKDVADAHHLFYTAVFSWITLTIRSSLEAIGLTAAFSNALANAQISCNVIAAFYHDHIFVGKQDAGKAMQVLRQLSEQ